MQDGLTILIYINTIRCKCLVSFFCGQSRVTKPFCFRAKRRLIMNKQLYHLLHGPAMDNFQKIRIPSSIPAHKTLCVFCAKNYKTDDNFPVAVWQEAVTVFPDRRFPGGPVCRACQSVPFRRIPLTDSGIQRLSSFGVPYTLNSWAVVMSGILGIPNPFKNNGTAITPVSRNMVNLCKPFNLSESRIV